VLFSVHQGRHETQVKILTPNASFQVLGRFLTHITCLAMCMVDRTLCAVIAAWSSDSVTLTFHPIGNGPSQIKTLPTFYGDENIYLEAFISIAVTGSIFGHLTLLCGTRNGFRCYVEHHRRHISDREFSVRQIRGHPSNHIQG
jgi:hypothetical protein